MQVPNKRQTEGRMYKTEFGKIRAELIRVLSFSASAYPA